MEKPRKANSLATSDELSRRIKAAREGAGLTQKQVAQAIGMPRTAVVQIEAGKRA
ncbi:MAG: helix-turn-helix transcriptional regulator, partial [Thermoanaerobaculia bacterium]